MGAEDWAERAVFEPARVELLKRRIRDGIIVGGPVAANVGGPIWISGQREIEAGRHLMAQAPVRAVDISGPHRRAHALLPEKC